MTAMEKPSDSTSPSSQTHLGLDLEQALKEYRSSIGLEQDAKKTTQEADPRRYSKRMMHIDTTDPRLDMALHFVSRGPLADLAKERGDADPLTARRRGRAIYLNDLLRYSEKEETTNFYSAVLQWRNDNGQGGDMGEEEENDTIVLLAQARSLAQSSTYPALNVSSLSSWQNGRRRDSKTTRKERRPKRQSSGLETSASSPEGALGKIALPRQVSFGAVKCEVEEMMNSSDSDDDLDFAESSSSEDETGEVDVLRAGLRFTLGCYDDLVKNKSSAASAICNREHIKTSIDETPASPVRTRSRSRSLIKALTMKGSSLTSDRSNRYSSVSSSNHESVLDLDNIGLDQIAGPSSRYGMANTAAFTSPSAEEKDPLDKISLSRRKSHRRSSDATSLSSPIWSRRPSRLETPCEQDEPNVEAVRVSQGSLASALQQMRRLDKGKLQGQSSIALSATQVDERVREEKVKSAALVRELETLKMSLSHLERQSNENAGLSDIERGARTDEEAMMMQAVAQAARDTVEAEEREAEWKAECENASERVKVLEQALYQAMGLLAGKDQSIDDAILHQPMQSQEEVLSPTSTPPTFTALEARQVDGRNTATSSPFYSAAEEDYDDDDLDEATPFASSLLRTSGARFSATLERYSRTGFNFESNEGEDIQRETRVFLEDKSPDPGSGNLQSDNDTLLEHRRETDDSQAEPVLISPRSSTSGRTGSRRESHASWVRHSILPPQTHLPSDPLPIPPISQKLGKTSVGAAVQEAAEQRDLVLSLKSKQMPMQDDSYSAAPLEKKSSTATGEIDYSSKAKAKLANESAMETVEVVSPPSDGHVSLYSSLRSAIAEEKKSMPAISPLSIQVDAPAEDTSSDGTNSSRITSQLWSPPITRNGSITTHDRRPSDTDTLQSRETSSSDSSIKNKNGRIKKGPTKMSILGHMPAKYGNNRSNSSPSIHSFDTQPSSTSNGLSEHYEKLAAGPNKTPGEAAFFTRRTRFRSAS